MPEWLGGRWTKRVARRLGLSTIQARMTPKDRARLGRIGGVAANRLKTQAQIDADCLHARNAYYLKIWRAAGFVLESPPCSLAQYRMLRAVADNPGACNRQLSRQFGFPIRTSWRACVELAEAGCIVVVDRGVKRAHPMTITPAGVVMLTKVECSIGVSA